MRRAALSLRRVARAQVDAFTATPCLGNAAAVCVLPSSVLPVSDGVRLAVAQENNLSETAFLEEAHGDDDAANSTSNFRLRWFTPSQEVPLCGHATLAAAAALILGCRNRSPVLRFQTQSGELRVSATAPPTGSGVGAAAQLCMELSSLPPVDPVPEPGARLASAAAGPLPVADVRFCKALRYLLVALRPGSLSWQDLQRHPVSANGCMTRVGCPCGAASCHGFATATDPPQFSVREMRAAYDGEDGSIGAVIVSSCDPTGDCQGPHVFSRFFAPWMGIDEDPVTGSAHSVLAPYYRCRTWEGQGWQASRRIAEQVTCYMRVRLPARRDVLKESRLHCRQCSARMGDMQAEVVGAERVSLMGSAVLVVAGELALPDEPS